MNRRTLLSRLLFNLTAFACGVGLSRLLRAAEVYEQPWWIAAPVAVACWGGLLMLYLTVSWLLANRGIP
jgi:hypothetical protein